MFVGLLSKEEKDKFLSLAYHIANIDGEYSDKEKEIIDKYKRETGLEFLRKGLVASELIDYFAKKNNSLKKVILLETYGLILSDGRIDKNEVNIFTQMEEKFEMGERTYQDIKNLMQDFKKVYDKMDDIIGQDKIIYI